MSAWIIVGLAVLVFLVGVVIYDLTQTRHAVLRNFPIVGHFRYILEAVGPELRQYIVTSNDEERPFSRNQRRWVYASAKQEINTFGFGSDNEMERTPGYLIIEPAPFPAAAPLPGSPAAAPSFEVPVGKVLGAARGRAGAFRPRSFVNISGMSFGALSGNAVEAMNRGAQIAGCLHNTGEGGLAEQHCHGADLMFQIGTAYFGCRDPAGAFSMEQLKETLARAPVKAIEIKLSQGAKPGLGGLVPAAKMTPEIARIRGVEPWKDCHSPPSHTAFHDVDGMLDFAELIAQETGLPVGIKSAVGDRAFWHDLAHQMATTGRGVDHITIDGGEGGTGAAPLAFADHVALPFKLAFARAYTAFARRDIQDDVVWVGSAKLGFPDATIFALALGCDMVNVGREAMMAVGCIQAQRCHTGRCPTGVATQTPRLTRGLVPDDKSVRVAGYVRALRGEVLALSRTMGQIHPALVEPDQLRLLTDDFAGRPVEEVFGYAHKWRQLAPERRAEVEAVARAAGGLAG